MSPIREGKHVVAKARTGTGKTLGFCLPLVEHLLNDNNVLRPAPGRAPRVLVLAPTRELAKQTTDEFINIGGEQLRSISVYGGTSIFAQQQQLDRYCYLTLSNIYFRTRTQTNFRTPTLSYYLSLSRYILSFRT